MREHPCVELSRSLGTCRVQSADELGNLAQREARVAWINPLGREGEVEVRLRSRMFSARAAQATGFEQREHDLFGRPRKACAFDHHQLPALEVLADGFGGGADV